MTCPAASTLLSPGTHPTMVAALATYASNYDEVFDDVHERLATRGQASKLDLAALIAWKHVRNARWMNEMLALPQGLVEATTKDAFAANMRDADRMTALRGIPGFGAGHAFTSVLLAAWHPHEFGVFDDRASKRGWPMVMTPLCGCVRADLPVYFDHLRQIADEMGGDWTPRSVDKALFKL